MKKYSFEMEGYIGEKCAPNDKGCGYKKAQRKNARQKTWRNVKEKAGKVVGGIIGLGGVAAGGYYGKKVLDAQK